MDIVLKKMGKIGGEIDCVIFFFQEKQSAGKKKKILAEKPKASKHTTHTHSSLWGN